MNELTKNQDKELRRVYEIYGEITSKSVRDYVSDYPESPLVQWCENPTERIGSPVPMP